MPRREDRYPAPDAVQADAAQARADDPAAQRESVLAQVGDEAGVVGSAGAAPREIGRSASSATGRPAAASKCKARRQVSAALTAAPLSIAPRASPNTEAMMNTALATTRCARGEEVGQQAADRRAEPGFADAQADRGDEQPA